MRPPRAALSSTQAVAGSAVLAGTAMVGLEWGFILLEGVWALVSAYSLIRKATGRPVAAH